MATEVKKRLFLFDVDGTLTEPRQKIEQKVVDMLRELHSHPDCVLALVGGSNYEKILEQVQHPELFTYMFCENGTVGYKDNNMIYEESIVKFLGEERLKRFLNYCLTYIANLDIPKKRGTFVELRKGLINVSPMGRNCSLQDRHEFIDYDAKNGVLKTFQAHLVKEFSDFNMKFAIGGQTSVDCFPKEWDKTNCLKHLEGLFREILFFGDRVHEGGNDYEIYRDKRVKGHAVKNPDDTVRLVNEIMNFKREKN